MTVEGLLGLADKYAACADPDNERVVRSRLLDAQLHLGQNQLFLAALNAKVAIGMTCGVDSLEHAFADGFVCCMNEMAAPCAGMLREPDAPEGGVS